MTNKKLHDSFNALPLDDRIALLRQMLSEIEFEVQQSKKITPAPTLLSPITDLDWVPEDPFDEQVAMDELRGGSNHTIDKLRLLDATDFLRGLLKKQGYIREQPSFDQLAQTLRDEEAQMIRRRTKPDWAEWVARDGPAIDGPADRDWKEWVVEDDPASEKNPQ